MPRPSETARSFAPDPSRRYKLVYLAQRNPDLAQRDFPQAWREHSQLAASFATSLGKHFLGSQQCVRDPAEGLDPTFGRNRDGSSILTMKSWEDLLAARYHPRSLDELKADEARVFAGPVDDWTMAVEEVPLIDGAPTDHVLLSFVTAREDCRAGRFETQSRAIAGRLADRPRTPARLVWNHVVDPARAYPFAAIVEAWYPNRDAALNAAGDSAVIAALEQREIADPDSGFRLFACINLARFSSSTAADDSSATLPAHG